MAVLVYVVRVTLTGLLGVSVTPAGPVNTVFTVTGSAIDGLSSTVHVKVTSAPTGWTGLTGSLVIVTMGAGTEHKNEIITQTT